MKKFVEDFEKLLEEYKGRAGEDTIACAMLVSDREAGYTSLQGKGIDLAMLLAHLITKDHGLFKTAVAFAAELAKQEAKNCDTNLN